MNTMKNSVLLIGQLGTNPEIRKFDNSTKVHFRLATHDYYTNKEGEKTEKTEWHNIVAWGKLAENMDRFLQKGQKVAIRGKLTHRQYEDKNGQTRDLTEIVTNDFELFSKSKIEA
ncbi:MAG TPA: single-stranded DNA-binding protein [Saprospiraceae bacterium]|nr:single-stranded DNA-binding protein [Saprospiraceae bacterium]